MVTASSDAAARRSARTAPCAGSSRSSRARGCSSPSSSASSCSGSSRSTSSRSPATSCRSRREIVRNASADIPRLLYYTWITGTEAVIGYVLAVVLAVPLGLAIAFSSVLRRTIYPFFVSLEMTPKIAFAPLFISWLGFGMLPKVIIVILVCFFPIVLNAILAFGSLSDELERFCRSTGAGPIRAFFKVRLPAAMPQCFVGLQIRGDQRDGRRDHRRVHRQRPGARLLHPDRHRQHAARPRLRRHLSAHLPRPRALRHRHAGRAAGHPLAHFGHGGQRE